VNAPRVLPALGVVAVGGALGAVLRASLGLAFPSAPDAFPWTTFVINVSGSLLLALLGAVPALRRHALMRPFLGAGLLGGYTTLSATSEEARLMLEGGDPTLATVYLVGTLAACLVGVHLARLYEHRERRETR
jgi:fluoride exporter